MSYVKFLGHVISRGGVAVNPSKVEAVINWEGLKNASITKDSSRDYISWHCLW